LAAERNFQLALVQFVGVRLALLELQIVKAGAEHLHGHLAILALAALGLARHDNICWEVGDANGSLHFVDVLAAFAAGTKRVNL
jgi:hypothetical protein